MIANVCGIDRIIRTIVSLVLIVIGIGVSHTVGWILGIVGLYLLFTAIFSYCIISSLAGANSCRIYIKDPLRDHEME